MMLFPTCYDTCLSQNPLLLSFSFVPPWKVCCPTSLRTSGGLASFGWWKRLVCFFPPCQTCSHWVREHATTEEKHIIFYTYICICKIFLRSFLTMIYYHLTLIWLGTLPVTNRSFPSIYSPIYTLLRPLLVSGDSINQREERAIRLLQPPPPPSPPRTIVPSTLIHSLSSSSSSDTTNMCPMLYFAFEALLLTSVWCSASLAYHKSCCQKHKECSIELDWFWV